MAESERRFLYIHTIYIYVTERTLVCWETSVLPAYCWLQFRYLCVCVRVCARSGGLGEQAENPFFNSSFPHGSTSSLFVFLCLFGDIKNKVHVLPHVFQYIHIVVIILMYLNWTKKKIKINKSSWGFVLSVGSDLVVGGAKSSPSRKTGQHRVVQRQPLICWIASVQKEIRYYAAVSLFLHSWPPRAPPWSHQGSYISVQNQKRCCLEQILHSSLKKHAYRDRVGSTLSYSTILICAEFNVSRRQDGAVPGVQNGILCHGIGGEFSLAFHWNADIFWAYFKYTGKCLGHGTWELVWCNTTVLSNSCKQ